MKTLKFLIGFFLTILLFSCQFTEEITIKRNGSGTYKLLVDMSAMTKAMHEMGQQDSIGKPLEKLDTIYYVKDVLEQKKDSLKELTSEERATLEALKDMRIHMKIDEASGIMLMDFGTDFKDLKDLDGIKKKIEKAQQLNDNKGESGSTVENHDIHYSYDGKHFIRKVVMRNLSAEEQEQYETQLDNQKMFLSGSQFKLVYKFPKKIKNVNFEGAHISDNRKTLTIQVSMDSLTINPQLLDLKVDF